MGDTKWYALATVKTWEDADGQVYKEFWIPNAVDRECTHLMVKQKPGNKLLLAIAELAILELGKKRVSKTEKKGV